MILEMTKPLTEMSIGNIFWGKGGQSVGLTTLPLSCAHCLEIWDLKVLEHSVCAQACIGIELPLALHDLMESAWHIMFNNHCASESYTIQAWAVLHICECGECGCNYEGQYECYFNMRHALQ